MELKDLMLRTPRLTLAVAESVTCGRIQAQVGGIPGASDFFQGGITVYQLEQKVKHLGVDRAVAEAVNSISAEVAAQMAQGACRLFQADLGIATTGYAEPSAPRKVTVPFAWWGLAHRQPDGKFVLRTGRVEHLGA